MTPSFRALLAALSLVAALALAGCGGDDADSGLAESEETASETVTPTPSASPSESPSEPAESPSGAETVDVTISSDQVSPMAQPVELGVGETLRLEVQSNRAAELHVHSNPEQTVEVTRGNTSVDLVFDKPGQVDVEEHESGVLILRVLVR